MKVKKNNESSGLYLLLQVLFYKSGIEIHIQKCLLSE